MNGGYHLPMLCNLVDLITFGPGDDCITVGSGGANVHVRNSYCQGGHGLSIVRFCILRPSQGTDEIAKKGSLGKDGAVASVHNIL